MDVEELLITVNNFYYDYPYIVIGIAVFLLIFLFLRPKQFFKLTVTLLILGAVFYVLALIGEAAFTGVLQKEKMVNRP